MVTRKEDRFFVDASKISSFIQGILAFSEEKEFKTNFNRTVYFNNDEHEVPFEVSIKARKYDETPLGSQFVLDPGEKWIFELKSDIKSENQRLRHKERKDTNIEQIVEEINSIFDVSAPLKPYTADDYRRRHFQIEGDFRITVDDMVRYYFFENGFRAEQTGSEENSIAEIKVPVEKLDSAEYKEITLLLETLNCQPAISKKDSSYNFLSDFLRKKANNRKVQGTDTEIEAKLVLEGKNQDVFHRIKKDFADGRINGFRIIPEFPHTLESGKIHKYVLDSDENLRLSMRGGKIKAVTKKDTEVFDSCIVKRKEIDVPFSRDMLLMDSINLYRKRKYFVAENTESGESYCILVDRSTSNEKELFQIEVENTSINGTKNEKAVIKDIKEIVAFITGKYPFLTPAPLTKKDWLKSL